LNGKLRSEEALKSEILSEHDESEMSEISVEDEIDCSVFTNEKEKKSTKLISENSVEFVRILKNKDKKILKEKATVFPKVKTVPTQFFVQSGLEKYDTHELTSMVLKDNSEVCDSYF